MLKSIKSTCAATAFALAGTVSHAATIVEIAASDGRFETLVAAVQAAGLADTLSGPGPFTVFAPVDAAFAALPAGTVETLLKPENGDQLTNVLLYHVDEGKIMSGDIPAGTTAITPLAADQVLCVTAGTDGVTVGDSTGQMAKVIIADIEADNGVIHVVDTVLLPGAEKNC